MLVRFLEAVGPWHQLIYSRLEQPGSGFVTVQEFAMGRRLLPRVEIRLGWCVGHGEERELLFRKQHGDWQMGVQRARNAGWGTGDEAPLVRNDNGYGPNVKECDITEKMKIWTVPSICRHAHGTYRVGKPEFQFKVCLRRPRDLARWKVACKKEGCSRLFPLPLGLVEARKKREESENCRVVDEDGPNMRDGIDKRKSVEADHW
jgi:hypothetical protein